MFNKNIDIIKKIPFTLFKIDNFLSNKLIKNLDQNFPKLSQIANNDLEIYKNKKYAFETNSQIHKKYLSENIYFSDFESIIFSKDFFDFFYKNFYFDFIKSK